MGGGRKPSSITISYRNTYNITATLLSCGDGLMAKATVSVSLPTGLLARLDERVERGDFDDRSDAVEKALRKMEDEQSVTTE